jgi:polysaccharide export outer membrane protein
MRASRLPILLLLALAASGCARHAAPPPMAAAPAASSELDAMTYGPPPGYQAPAMAERTPVAVPVIAVGGEYVEPPYTLDSGDKLRIVVFGQDGLTNSYSVDAAGRISMPLIGAVTARGLTPAELGRSVAARLRKGYIREPHVAVEVETYRPFFILGEVTAPGQYSYVANMTVETAVAIAGGFTPRASHRRVDLTRTRGGETMRGAVPLGHPVRPGDTIVVNERWF